MAPPAPIPNLEVKRVSVGGKERVGVLLFMWDRSCASMHPRHYCIHARQ